MALLRFITANMRKFMYRKKYMKSIISDVQAAGRVFENVSLKGGDRGVGVSCISRRLRVCRSYLRFTFTFELSAIICLFF